jgi:hypothetical protein
MYGLGPGIAGSVCKDFGGAVVTCPSIFSSRDYDSILNGFGGGAAFIEQTFTTQPVGDYTFSFWAYNLGVAPNTNLYGALRPGDGGDIAPCSVPDDGVWHQCVFAVLNTAVSRAAIGYEIQGSGGTAALPAWRPFGVGAGAFRGLITGMNVYPGTSAGPTCIQSEINYCDSFFEPSELTLPLPGFADPQFGWTTYFAGTGVLPVLTAMPVGPGNSGSGTCYGTQGGGNVLRCPPIFNSTRMQVAAQVGAGLEIIYRGWDQGNGGTGNFFQFDGGPQRVRMSFWARGTPGVGLPTNGFPIFFENLTEGNGNGCEIGQQADGGSNEVWRECSYAYTMTAATPGTYFYVGYHSGGGGNTPGVVPAGDWQITGFNVRYGLGTSGGLGGADLQGPYCAQP